MEEIKKISFVIPCYRSEKTLPGVVDEIQNTMAQLSKYDYEIVLVNDCSPDDTFEVICELAEKNGNIIGANLAKNFGQHAALMAGYGLTTGDVVVSLDDDGQTPANEVGKLIEEVEAGQDVVYANYINKHHSGIRNLGSKINDLMARVMLSKPKDLYVGSYYAARRFVIDEMLKYQNSYPYVMGLVLRSTKRISNVDVEHREREIGTSGYSMGKLLALWMNGFTAFSVKPLRIATVCGAVLAAFGFVYGIITIIRKLLGINYVLGYSGLMSMLTFIGGMLMLMVGMAGEYIGRSYMALNAAPQYVIRETVGEISK